MQTKTEEAQDAKEETQMTWLWIILFIVGMFILALVTPERDDDEWP